MKIFYCNKFKTHNSKVENLATSYTLLEVLRLGRLTQIVNPNKFFIYLLLFLSFHGLFQNKQAVTFVIF